MGGNQESNRSGKLPGEAPPGGWLRAARLARGVAQQALADKLGCARQAWAQLEASEARGAISLYSLRRAAGALGYDVVYYLVPKPGADAPPGRPAREDTSGDRAPDGVADPSPPPVAPAEAYWPESELPTELR